MEKRKITAKALRLLVSSVSCLIRSKVLLSTLGVDVDAGDKSKKHNERCVGFNCSARSCVSRELSKLSVSSTWWKQPTR